MFDHQQTYEERELHLLKHGRHLRLNPGSKIIVGRTQQDNDKIMSYYNSEEDLWMKSEKIPGPSVLMPHGGSPDDVRLAASICVSYSPKAPKDIPLDIAVTTPHGKEIVQASGISQEIIQRLLILGENQ